MGVFIGFCGRRGTTRTPSQPIRKEIGSAVRIRSSALYSARISTMCRIRKNLTVLVVLLCGQEDALGLLPARYLEPHFTPVSPDLDGEVEEWAAQSLQSNVLRQRDQHLRFRRVPEGVTVFQFPRLVKIPAQLTPQRQIPLALLGVHHREVAGERRFAVVVSRLHVLLL